MKLILIIVIVSECFQCNYDFCVAPGFEGHPQFQVPEKISFYLFLEFYSRDIRSEASKIKRKLKSWKQLSERMRVHK